MVAALILRGLTQRDIVIALENQQRINPETNEPWSLGTINSDVQALNKQWKEEASKDIDEYKASQLAEIREARKEAWKQKDVGKVYKGLEVEMNLTGTTAPTKQQNSGIVGTIDMSTLSIEQLKRVSNGEPLEQVLSDS